MTQTAGIIGIFISGHNLVNALPQQGQRSVAHTVVLSWIAQACGPVASQMMALIEGTQRQKTGIAGDLAAGKISPNEVMAVEGEGQLWYNTLYQAMDAPKGDVGPLNPVFINPVEHPFFLGLRFRE